MIDDFIPCIDDVPAFSSHSNGDIWILLLEKACAKINGSYEQSKISKPHHILRDLTGAPNFEWDIEEKTELFSKIIDSHKNGYLMMISIKEGDADELKKLNDIGLCGNTAFTVTRVACFRDE